MKVLDVLTECTLTHDGQEQGVKARTYLVREWFVWKYKGAAQFYLLCKKIVNKKRL